MTPESDFDLSEHNALGVACRAEFGLVARTEQELLAALSWADKRQLTVSVLGGGSNVIPAPEVAGLVVLLKTRGLQWQAVSGSVTGARLTVQAGENWHDLVRYSLGRGLGGLESLALIPGNVGAAPIQNIGAYGSELSQSLVAVRVFDRKVRALRELSADECGFGYRASRFKSEKLASSSDARFIVLSVELELEWAQVASVEASRYADVNQELLAMGCTQVRPVQVAEAVCRIRRRKLPDVRRIGNVGSVFKNPVVTAAKAERLRTLHSGLKMFAVGDGVRLSAAQLIDLAGWKGHQHRGAAVWQRQPLVLVQTPQRPRPDSAAFSELLASIRSDIHKRYEVVLEVEPQPLGAAGG